MEEAAKSIESLAKNILPSNPYCLSISPTRRYRPHPDEKRLEEQEFRPLQYQTFVTDADRGVTLTRAYFDIREDPIAPHNATSNAPTPRPDPTKPITKLSLKDYKNRTKAPDGEFTPKPRAAPSNPVAPRAKLPPPPSKHAPEVVAKDMEGHGDAKKSTSNSKVERMGRRHSPAPDTRKRAPAREEDARPAKRIKGDDVMPNAPSARLLKGDAPNKLERKISHEKKPSRDLKPLPAPTTNGRSALGSLSNRSSSPKPAARVNGSQKSTTSANTPKKVEGNSHSQTSSVPPLLSPLRIDGLDPKSGDIEPIRASPKKKTEENNSTKPMKKPREDREPSPSPKKRKAPLKIPPLLSPTLPPIVMEELAKTKKTTSSKDLSQKSSSSQAAESPQPSAQKTVKSSKREETIHVESKKEEPDSYMVTLKYKKRITKTVERLLALPPGGRRKAEVLKKEERSARERSDSREPSIAPKRPRTGTDVHPTEATKRPRTSEILQPSTPLPKQSAAMTRVASSSSLAGTPGAGNDLTPSTQPPLDARRALVDLEQIRKLQSKVKIFRELGTKLKHERDAIMRERGPSSDHEHHAAMGAGTQSLLAYMLSFKLEADCRDLEQKARFPNPWKDMIPLIRAIKSDCRSHNQISALLVRIQGICLVYLARALWSYPNQPEAAKDLLQNSKDQQETWRLAEKTRRNLGVYDGARDSNDGGPVGKLIDRLGPWSSPEDAIPVAIEILRRTIRSNSQWRPSEELARWGHSLTNGVPS